MLPDKLMSNSHSMPMHVQLLSNGPFVPAEVANPQLTSNVIKATDVHIVNKDQPTTTNGAVTATNSERKPIKFLYSNVETISNKRAELELLIDTEKPDIIGLVEIFPKTSDDRVLDKALLPLKHPKRGVALWVKKGTTTHNC